MKKLITFILPFVLIYNLSFAQNWFPLGTGVLGLSTGVPPVNSLKVFNDELIVAGHLSNAGGVSVINIAKWNGTSWSAFSGGNFNNYIYALEIFNNQLIAGGKFTSAISKWDGTSWSSLGSGLTGGGLVNSVSSISTFNNNLIAGGFFSNAGGVSVNNIAKWDGTSWSALGNGIIGGSYGYNKVNALIVYNNELYAGGYFDTAGSVKAANIAKWNGTSWSVVGSGTNSFVYAFAIYNNQLIVGGSFDTAGGLAATGIAKWNGTNWSTLGSGTSGTFHAVQSLYVYNSDLIAGGNFSIIGGINANRIAKWNGSAWSALGTGVSGNSNETLPQICAITKYGNDIIAGGAFIIAGLYAANNIAKWGMTFGIKQISTNIPDKFLLEQNYPNPFNPSTNIRYQITDNRNVILKIYDALGKEIKTLVNEKQSPGTYEVSFDGSALSSGIYYYTLTAGDFKETKRMVLVK